MFARECRPLMIATALAIPSGVPAAASTSAMMSCASS
jgi:hypothetical protein